MAARSVRRPTIGPHTAFLTAFSLVAFVAVHVAMVLVSGVFNNLRSMVTGYYDIGQGGKS
ncbi:hypothetical protein FHS25_000596 [Rhizobium laguerreae]|uniref:Cytochrome b561 bacterial/Ni-hydrogenase domain-containing protein n=1 Tax=Rhizobium laguerreae TaxID=1076926 RepID=A0ABR6G1K7_9HYPH|nr:hypothetical protein [Rhizobium laguerreae]